MKTPTIFDKQMPDFKGVGFTGRSHIVRFTQAQNDFNRTKAAVLQHGALLGYITRKSVSSPKGGEGKATWGFEPTYKFVDIIEPIDGKLLKDVRKEINAALFDYIATWDRDYVCDTDELVQRELQYEREVAMGKVEISKMASTLRELDLDIRDLSLIAQVAAGYDVPTAFVSVDLPDESVPGIYSYQVKRRHHSGDVKPFGSPVYVDRDDPMERAELVQRLSYNVILAYMDAHGETDPECILTNERVAELETITFSDTAPNLKPAIQAASL